MRARPGSQSGPCGGAPASTQLSIVAGTRWVGRYAASFGGHRVEPRPLAHEALGQRVVECEQDLEPAHAHLRMLEREPHLRRVELGLGGDARGVVRGSAVSVVVKHVVRGKHLLERGLRQPEARGRLGVEVAEERPRRDVRLPRRSARP